MKTLSGQPDISELSAAFDRIAEFQAEIERVPANGRDHPNQRLSRSYNLLRDAVVEMTTDIYRMSLAPSRVRCLTNWQLAALAVMEAVSATALILWYTSQGWNLDCFAIAILVGLLLVLMEQLKSGFLLPESLIQWLEWDKSVGAFFATPNQVSLRTSELEQWLRSYQAARYSWPVDPALAPQAPQASSTAPSPGHAAPTPAGGTPPPRGDAVMRHLQQQVAELQSRYEALSKRIAALDKDLGRTLDSEAKLTLEERRQELVLERNLVADQMARIEHQLSA